MWRLQVFTVITTNDVCRVYLMLFHCTMHLRSQHSVVPSRWSLHTIYKASQMPFSVQLEKVVCMPSSTTWLIQTQRNQGTLVRQGTDECHSGLHQIMLWSLLSMLAVIYQVGKLPCFLPCRPTLLFVCQLTIVWLLQRLIDYTPFSVPRTCCYVWSGALKWNWPTRAQSGTLSVIDWQHERCSSIVSF